MGWRRLSGWIFGSVVLVVALASCSQPTSNALSTQGVPVVHGTPLGIHPAGPANAPVCPGPVAHGTAGCTARVITDQKGKPQSNPTPSGYAPAQLWKAYGFGSPSGSKATIAIVDAYDDPTAAEDLTTFTTHFGVGACTLTKLDQTGNTNYPKVDTGWALEISLDVQWACAIAPGARIVLVEANSNSYSDLMAAVDTAAQLAPVVSMSWGGGESSSETSYDGHFQVADVTFTASSGDNGAGVIYPAASPYVVGVGGTTLPLDINGGLTGTETAWSGSGGGISAYEAQPAYQANYAGTPGNLVYANGSRAVPDVAYDADPSTGFSVYDSTGYKGTAGWFVVGGTSAGAPQWAALFALADEGRSTALGSASTAWSPVYALGSSYFTDITSGDDCSSGPKHGPKGGGSTSSTLCQAVAGYDLVTGLGSPLAGALIPALNTWNPPTTP